MKQKNECPRCKTSEYAKRIEEGAYVCLRPIRLRPDGSWDKCWYHIEDEVKETDQPKVRVWNKREEIIAPIAIEKILSKEELKAMQKESLISDINIRNYNIKLEFALLIKEIKFNSALEILAKKYFCSTRTIKRAIYSIYPKLITGE